MNDEWLHFYESDRHPIDMFTKTLLLHVIFSILAAIFRNTYFPGHPVAVPGIH